MNYYAERLEIRISTYSQPILMAAKDRKKTPNSKDKVESNTGRSRLNEPPNWTLRVYGANFINVGMIIFFS